MKLQNARRKFGHLIDAEKGQIHSNQIVKISVLAPPKLAYLPLTKQPGLCNELRKHKMTEGGARGNEVWSTGGLCNGLNKQKIA